MATEYLIEGGNKIHGEVTVGGSQQQAAFALVSSVLAKGWSKVTNVPDTIWIAGLLDCLRFIGVAVEQSGNNVKLNTEHITTTALPASLVAKSPYSILLIGSLLSRSERVSFEYSGLRYPFDGFRYHKELFNKTHPHTTSEQAGYFIIHGKASNREIVLEQDASLVCAQAIFTALSSQEPITIKNLCSSPDITFLLDTLRSMGITVDIIRPEECTVHASQTIQTCTVSMEGDVDEAIFWSIAAVVTKGDIVINGITSETLTAFLSKLTQANVSFKLEGNSLSIWHDESKTAHGLSVDIRPYPGIIPQWLGWFIVLVASIKDTSTITQSDQWDNMPYLEQLKQFGLEYNVDYFDSETIDARVPQRVTIFGGKVLHGGPVDVHTVREALVLLLAALSAEELTTIMSDVLLEQAFEKLVEKILILNGNINIV